MVRGSTSYELEQSAAAALDCFLRHRKLCTEQIRINPGAYIFGSVTSNKCKQMGRRLSKRVKCVLLAWSLVFWVNFLWQRSIEHEMNDYVWKILASLDFWIHMQRRNKFIRQTNVKGTVLRKNALRVVEKFVMWYENVHSRKRAWRKLKSPYEISKAPLGKTNFCSILENLRQLVRIQTLC